MVYFTFQSKIYPDQYFDAFVRPLSAIFRASEVHVLYSNVRQKQ